MWQTDKITFKKIKKKKNVFTLPIIECVTSFINGHYSVVTPNGNVQQRYLASQISAVMIFQPPGKTNENHYFLITHIVYNINH